MAGSLTPIGLAPDDRPGAGSGLLGKLLQSGVSSVQRRLMLGHSGADPGCSSVLPGEAPPRLAAAGVAWDTPALEQGAVLGLFLGVAGSMATPRITAQVVTEVPPQEIGPGVPADTIITGDNIGFQLVATTRRGHGDVATGKWMIKVDGRWLPTATPAGVMPAR